MAAKVSASELFIDPIFSASKSEGGPLCELTPFERQKLEEQIREEGGIRDALVYWDRNGHHVLLDGNNRYDIWQKSEGKIPEPACVPVYGLEDNKQAIAWIKKNDGGRRGAVAERIYEMCLAVGPEIVAEAERLKHEGQMSGTKYRSGDLPAKIGGKVESTRKTFDAAEEIRKEVERRWEVKPERKVARKAAAEIRGHAQAVDKQIKSEADTRSRAELEAAKQLDWFADLLKKTAGGTVFTTPMLKDVCGSHAAALNFLGMCEVSPLVDVVRTYGGGKKRYQLLAKDNLGGDKDCSVKLELACEGVAALSKINGLPSQAAQIVDDLVLLLLTK